MMYYSYQVVGIVLELHQYLIIFQLESLLEQNS